MNIGMLSEARRRGRAPLAAVVAVTLAAATAALAGCGPAPSVRDQHWQQDIAYLARRLPLVHVRGLTSVSRTTWTQAAHRLEQQVPRLTSGQIIAGMARMVALLHDDETQLILPPSAAYPFAARWIGDGLYLIAAPAADRWLLGARLTAVDGHPLREVVAQLSAVIDYQDPGEARGWEVGWDKVSQDSPGYLNNASLLHWLGIARSAAAARFTVRTTQGSTRTIRLAAAGQPGSAGSAGSGFPPVTYLPVPAYLRDSADPYWLRVLDRQRAVYLKYNRCLPGTGFQKVANRALADLRAHPGYRLIVDLRNNPGGDSRPFQSLISGIRADPAINRRGRIFGLVNDFTASSATVDTYNLGHETNALLIGQPAADPIDEFGNDNQLLRLPHYGVVVQYTTAVINAARVRFGIPDIGVAPTLHDWLTGQDPVLAMALAYGRSTRP